MIARIITPWTEVEGGNSPLLNDVLIGRTGWCWTDVTGQPGKNIPTDPNLYVVEIECDAETLAVIAADSRFLVLWSEDG